MMVSETVTVCSKGFILFGWLVSCCSSHHFPKTQPHTSKQKAYQLQTFLSLSSPSLPPLFSSNPYPTDLHTQLSINPPPPFHISLPPSSNGHLPSLQQSLKRDTRTHKCTRQPTPAKTPPLGQHTTHTNAQTLEIWTLHKSKANITSRLSYYQELLLLLYTPLITRVYTYTLTCIHMQGRGQAWCTL